MAQKAQSPGWQPGLSETMREVWEPDAQSMCAEATAVKVVAAGPPCARTIRKFRDGVRVCLRLRGHIMRIPIHIQRQIVALLVHDPKLSSRAVARQFGLSTGPIKTLREALSRCALAWPQLKAADDAGWLSALGTADRSISRLKKAPDMQWLHEQMQYPGATLTTLWEDWRAEHPDGLGYTQVSAAYRKFLKHTKLSLRHTHIPGDKVFVDFAGSTVPVLRGAGEPPLKAQIFIGVLGHSNYSFIRAVASQAVGDWIELHVKMFEFFGGVPR